MSELFPRIFTERLQLRKLEVEDLPALVRYANDRTVSDNIVNIPFPYREPDAAFRIGFVLKGFKDKTRYVFAIIHKEREELIGEISLHLVDKVNRHAQLAYWIGAPFRNEGLMSEAVAVVLDFGFNKLEFDLIYGDCKPENVASAKVMQRNGMTKHSKRGKLDLYVVDRETFDKEE